MIAALAFIGVVILGMKSVPEGSLATSFGAVSGTNAPAANTTLINGYQTPNPTVLDYTIARGFMYTDKALGFGNSTGVTILQQAVRQAIVPGSSTICSLQNPFTSTSTYEFTFRISSTSANANVFILAAAATSTVATTSTAGLLATNNGSVTLAANTTLTWGTQGTTSSAVSGVVPGSGYLNLGGLAGNDNALLQYGGNCNAVFTSTI